MNLPNSAQLKLISWLATRNAEQLALVVERRQIPHSACSSLRSIAEHLLETSNIRVSLIGLSREELGALTNLEKAPKLAVDSLEEAAFVTTGSDGRQLLLPADEIRQIEKALKFPTESHDAESLPLTDGELRGAASKSLSLSVNIADFLQEVRENVLQISNDGAPKSSTKKLLNTRLAASDSTDRLWSLSKICGITKPSCGALSITSQGVLWQELDDLERFIALATAWWRAAPPWLRQTVRSKKFLRWDESLDAEILNRFPLFEDKATLHELKSEAALQGLIHDARPTPWGTAIWQEAEVLPQIIPYWPKYSDGIIANEDFTLLAAGPIQSNDRKTLSAFSIVELGGMVPRYRITNDSVRNALQAGHSANEIMENLRNLSITEMPPNIKALVEDIDRRARGIRIRATDRGSSIVTSTSILAEELLADPNLRVLALKRFGENEVFSPWTGKRVLGALLSASYPALIVDASDDPVRPEMSSPREEESATSIKFQSRLENLVESTKKNTNFGIPASVYSLLEVATESRISLELDMTLEDGSSTTIVVEPRSLTGARLRALETTQSVEKTFPVSSIRAVRAPEN